MKQKRHKCHSAYAPYNSQSNSFIIITNSSNYFIGLFLFVLDVFLNCLTELILLAFLKY